MLSLAEVCARPSVLLVHCIIQLRCCKLIYIAQICIFDSVTQFREWRQCCSMCCRKKYLNTIQDQATIKKVCRRMACCNCKLADSTLIGEAVDFCIKVRYLHTYIHNFYSRQQGPFKTTLCSLLFTKLFRTSTLLIISTSLNRATVAVKIKSAQRDTNLRAGTLQPDRTFQCCRLATPIIVLDVAKRPIPQA